MCCGAAAPRCSGWAPRSRGCVTGNPVDCALGAVQRPVLRARRRSGAGPAAPGDRTVSRGRRTPPVALLVVLLALVLAGCSTPAGGRAAPDPGTGAGANGGVAAGGDAPVVPYDVRPLLSPQGKYLGVALDGAPDSTAVVDRYAGQVGRRPNLITFYTAWGDRFDTAGAAPPGCGALADDGMGAVRRVAAADRGRSERRLHPYVRRRGARPQRPRGTQLRPRDERRLVPVGRRRPRPPPTSSRPGGTCTTCSSTPERQRSSGCGTRTWSTRCPRSRCGRSIRATRTSTGSASTGYYTSQGAHTFASLFGPTQRSVRAFTRRPILIAETGAEQGPRKPPMSRTSSPASPVPGRGRLRLVRVRQAGRLAGHGGTGGAAEYRKNAADPRFGFDPRHP